MNNSFFPHSEQTRVSMMNLDLRLGAFYGASIISPSLDPFLPWFYFFEISFELFASHFIGDLCFIPPLCIDGSHKRVSLAQETTHNDYLPGGMDPTW
jgi:hypothetical protein